MSTNYNYSALLNEFKDIPMDLTDDSYSDAIIYSDRNKYQDIRASNKNWVKIKSGYINACYVLGDMYISTQYPIYNTLDHFWNLVLETGSNLIINLSGNNNYLVEAGLKRSNLRIEQKENNSIYEYNHIINDEEIIHHINFKKWPDKGVPLIKDMVKLIDFINGISFRKMKIKMYER